MTDQNKATVRRLIEEVLNDGRLEIIDELYDPELAPAARRWITPFRVSFPAFTWRSLTDRRGRQGRGPLHLLSHLLIGSLLTTVAGRGAMAGLRPRPQAAAGAAGAAAPATTNASSAPARSRGSARPAPPATPPATRS
jgi:hypothetical protein